MPHRHIVTMKRIIRKTKEKIADVGIQNFITGIVKTVRYRILQKKYHFDIWHVSPYELRKYLQDAAKYINHHNPGLVVDLGCGLGDLLSKVKAPKKIGYDINREPVHVAKYLCRRDRNLEFHVGSFDEIKCEEPIDYFVALGFMHGAKESTWEIAFRLVCDHNTVKHFLIDTVPENTSSGTHLLDFRKILPPEYVLYERKGPYTGGRYLEIWQNQA